MVCVDSRFWSIIEAQISHQLPLPNKSGVKLHLPNGGWEEEK